jgi:beta-1,4-N-acetylglucosaminyltransferase
MTQDRASGELRARDGFPHRGNRTRRRRRRKVALVGSSGGHLMHLHVLRSAWSDLDRFWVTFDTPDAASLLEGERVYYCYHPTNRHIPNLIRNTVLTVQILAKERPTHILSTGAAVAIPFFFIGRFLGMQLIFLEVFDRIDSPTITGRLVRLVAQHFLVQWPEQRALYPGAEVIGPVL